MCQNLLKLEGDIILKCQTGMCQNQRVSEVFKTGMCQNLLKVSEPEGVIIFKTGKRQNLKVPKLLNPEYVDCLGIFFITGS